ncbi:polyprenyl synthetase family protein [Anaeromyxobacter paludicola]|uniref:Heptaprenyl diphosphate synthase subunit II n=1 Tax=Anaeromyxobacter paludicola TaxID=2918171 RepID=A0ABM7XE26_9BACT|nr:polyprenyl synthetase family protein [Anaeromyxobacter paludicola]BDG10125.1 heptaprenyl diphosphate synthase subunit II [Anaeromyxobacter paludicola]
MRSSEQAILSQLDASAERGARPERAQAALQEVPRLGEELMALEQQLSRATADAEETLKAAARHLVLAGGKRIRPTVTLLACGACGGELATAVPFAVAAELTHSATLLHDDVIDDGPMRRGQPTSRVIWGNAVSVLTGDWLLTRALELVAEQHARPAALPALLATMRRLVEGEVLQLSLRGSFEATERDYFDVVEGKTASLFGWSAAAGAWAAGIRGEVPRALGVFGEGIGIAFQLVDDALDYAAAPELLGKRLGTDLLEGKATLPLIRACEAEPLLRQRLSALVEGKAEAHDVAGDVIEAVKRSGGVEAARAIAREHTGRAMAALERVPDGVHRRAIAEAAQQLTERAF